MIALMGLLLIITEQYLQPTISNSISPFKELNWARMIGAHWVSLHCWSVSDSSLSNAWADGYARALIFHVL